jgi:hypothetical protein
MAGPDYDPQARPERARLAMFGRIAFAVVCVSCALVAAMWLLFGGEDAGGPPPVISAEAGPDRVRPDPSNPTGQQIPHQERQVFDVVTGDDGRSRQELLTDGGEEPVVLADTANGAEIASRPAPQSGQPIQLLPPKPAPLNIDPPEPRQPPAQQQAPATRPPALIVTQQATPEAPRQQAAPQAVRPPQLVVTPEPARQAPAPAPQAAPQAPPPVVAQPAPKPEPQRRQTASLPPSDSYRIQIAAVRSEAAAQREWQRLRRKNKDILGRLQLFMQQVNIRNKGVYHRIQAGPLPDRTLAELACGSLKARGVGCLIVAQ